MLEACYLVKYIYIGEQKKKKHQSFYIHLNMYY